MNRLVICAAVAIVWIGACSDAPDEIGARARGYRDFEQVNARSFLTAQHQGNPQVNVFANELAAAPYRALAPMPVDAMVVKEMLDADGGSPILTVMIKQPAGYDPAHGDWWYGRLDVDGTPTGSGLVGKVSFCIGCHDGAPTGDHLFGVAADNRTPPS